MSWPSGMWRSAKPRPPDARFTRVGASWPFLLQVHFGDKLTAKCGHQPCANRVNAARAWIVAKDDYTAGMSVQLVDHALVVCPTHAKDGPEPVRHLYSANPRLVEM